MKNKLITIACVILLIIGYLAYRGFATYYLITESKKLFKNKPDIFSKEKSIWNIKPDNNNFPEYALKFVPDEKYQSELTDISNYIYKEKNIYTSYFQKELIDKIERILPNNLSDYKSYLVSSIKKKMTVAKTAKQPSFNESFDLPAMPKGTLFTQTSKYWYALSRLFEVKNQDYETSLLLSLGVFYLSKDMITNYCHSFTTLNKAFGNSMNQYACDSILIWASKPKNQYGTLSKKVAKDILDFVKTEYSFSNFLEINRVAADADFKIIFKHFAKGWLKKFPNSRKYNNLMSLLYEKPQKFIDKPLYELEKELNEMQKDEDKLYEDFDKIQTEPVKAILKIFFFTEDVVATRFIASYYPNLKRLKRGTEDTLAKMEFTAIALAINSFYAEKNRIPTSIAELNSWFGEDLPKNRLSGEPYKLDLEGKHLLTNEQFDLGMNKLYFDLVR